MSHLQLNQQNAATAYVHFPPVVASMGREERLACFGPSSASGFDFNKTVSGENVYRILTGAHEHVIKKPVLFEILHTHPGQRR